MRHPARPSANHKSLDDLTDDPPTLAVALADIATVYQRRGESSDAAQLVAAAQLLTQRIIATTPLGTGERARIDAAAAGPW